MNPATATRTPTSPVRMATRFEPTEHTGLLGNYNITSSLNFQAGVADTVTTEGA